MQAKLDDLRQRKEEAYHAGSARAVERQHAKGKMLARERIEYLLDPGSFQELDLLARHRAQAAGLEERPYTDGVITGWGTIDGRKVFVFSQDFTVFGGALGEVFAEKIHKLMDLALKVGAPVIGLNDGAGARIQEGVVSLRQLRRHLLPQRAVVGRRAADLVILGPCAGGAVYCPAMTDFIFMVRETSHMFITGPDVVKTVTGEEVTLEELGGAMSHATKSGVATFVSPDEKSCLEDVRYLLSFLPSNNLEEPPDRRRRRRPRAALRGAARPPAGQPEPALRHEEGHHRGRRRRRVLRVLPALGQLDRLRLRPPRTATPSASSATSRWCWPACSTSRASEKAARFVRTCDAFNIPLITFVDVPGLPARRRPGVRRHHPPRRQAALRLLRGHRAAHPDHHPQGLRRRLRRHELEVDRRRPGVRLADGRAGRDGAAGRGRDRLPARAAAGRRPGRPARPSWSPSTPRSTPTRTPPPSGATSTT